MVKVGITEVTAEDFVCDAVVETPAGVVPAGVDVTVEGYVVVVVVVVVAVGVVDVVAGWTSSGAFRSG